MDDNLKATIDNLNEGDLVLIRSKNFAKLYVGFFYAFGGDDLILIRSQTPTKAIERFFFKGKYRIAREDIESIRLIPCKS